MKKKSVKNTKKVNNKKEKKTKKKGRFGKLLLSFIVFCAIIAILAGAGLVAYIVMSAPPFSPNNLYEKESTIIYDKDNNLIATLGVNTDSGTTEKRQKVSYDDLPQVLVDAIIATEDSRFFQHNGFDLPRFAKATAGQLLGRDAGGASTLTMQVSKNSFTSLDATGIKGIIRKFTDIYMSIFKIEKHYTKENIIEFYVNAPFLGSGAYGVQQASKVYFGKEVNDLSLSEAAIIAGLFQAPTAYDPYLYPENTADRRATVLYLMRKHGYISKEAEDAANAIPVEKLLASENKNSLINQYQGFIDTVIQDVRDTTGNDPYNTPMIIYSTMNTAKQNVVNDVTNNYKFYDSKIQFASAVIDNETGAIVAIGAGRNKDREMGLNYATSISKHIGSTAKPLFDYGPGIEYEKWSTYTPFFDENNVTYSSGAKISNFDKRYVGVASLYSCLSTSKNTCAVQAFQKLENHKIYEFVTSLGITPESDNGSLHEAHALGAFTGTSPLQLAAAYAAFGNGGYYTKPYSFTKLIYRDTKEEYETEIKKTKVMSKQTAYMISYILRAVTPSGAKVYGTDVSTKTGTSNYDSAGLAKVGLSANIGVIQDSWIVSYTTKYTISSWNGYDQLTKSNYITTNSADYQRKAIMARLAQGIFEKNDAYAMPTGIVSAKVEKETIPAMKPSDYTPSNMIETHLFLLGTEPTETSQRYAKLSNPTNLSVQKDNNILNVSWASPGTPTAVDTNYLQKYFSDNFTPFEEIYYQRRLDYNTSSIGTFGYDVYLVNSTSAKYIGTTNDTTYTIDLSNYSGNYNKVKIVSSYSIFKANKSDGVEYVFNEIITPSVVDVSLPNYITLYKNDSWNGSTKNDLTIKVDGQTITATDSTVSIDNITNSNKVAVAINDITKNVGTYKVKYNISFVYLGQNYSNKTFQQTITVQEKVDD